MKRPWMNQRDGETVRQFHDRLNRTCYACGHESPTVAACDEHEETCPQARKQGRKHR